MMPAGRPGDDSLMQELMDAYARERDTILLRLSEFRSVPRERYFYEMCFCLMTPQSSAVQCNKVALELERLGFRETPFDPVHLLRSFDGGYVRFHATKARRLLEARATADELFAQIEHEPSDKQAREIVVRRVNGLGYKEASHFLRNIGRTQLTIIDRHILRNLHRLGVIDDTRAPSGRRQYLAVEEAFERTATLLGIPSEEFDLLLWSRETGFILK